MFDIKSKNTSIMTNQENLNLQGEWEAIYTRRGHR